jgi:CDP-diacylglycerol--glycerol-3-phosphate 3-phosphatidyltransferase
VILIGRKTIPWTLVAFRALMAPALVAMAVFAPAPQLWLGAMIAAGFVSDVYDGILARRWGTATDALRIADSATDVLFYLGILAAAVVRHGPVLLHVVALIAAVLALEVIHIIFCWFKYGRMASYHSYVAKSWGVMLATATIALLCFDGAFWLLTVALVWGVVCELEGIAMSMLLPQWVRDVKTLRRAWQIRGDMRNTYPVHAGL